MLSTMFTYIYTGKDNLFWLSFVLKYLKRTSTSVRPHRHVTIVSKIILKLSHNRFSLRALLEPKTSSLSALSCTDSFGMEIITRLWIWFDISVKIFHWLLSFSWNSMACDLLFLSIGSMSSFSLMYCSCTIRDESRSDPESFAGGFAETAPDAWLIPLSRGPIWIDKKLSINFFS